MEIAAHFYSQWRETKDTKYRENNSNDFFYFKIQLEIQIRIHFFQLLEKKGSINAIYHFEFWF